MANADGKVVISTALDNSGIKKGAGQVKGAFGGLSSAVKTASNAMQNAFNGNFNKSVAMAQARVRDLERQFESATIAYNDALKADDDSAAERASNRRIKLYDQIKAAREKLSIQMQAASQREASVQNTGTTKVKSGFATLSKAANSFKNTVVKAFSGAKSIISGLGKAVSSIKGKFSSASKSVGRFGSRFKQIVSGALFFNLLSSAIRKMTEYFGSALSSSTQMQESFANLKGAAMTAAAPIIDLLTPALTALANCVATVLSYLSQLISFFTGKSVAAMSSAAKKMQGAAGTAKKAAASLAGFDEIQKLNSDNAGGGGMATISPNYDFKGESSFLDSIMESVKGGDWKNVGATLSKELSKCLKSVKWPDIKKKAAEWMGGLADGINGFVGGLDFGAVGDTIGESINTLIVSVGSFVAQTDWSSLGNGIGTAISNIFLSIDWEQYKMSLTEGFNGILELIAGFAEGFAPLQGINFTEAVTSLQDLWDSLMDFVEVVGGSLAEVYKTVLKPLLGWAIESAVPATVDVLTEAFNALSEILIPVMDGIDGLMTGLQPVIAFIEEVVMIALNGLKDLFERLAYTFMSKGEEITTIVSGIGEIVAIVWARLEPIINTAKEYIRAAFETVNIIVEATIGAVLEILGGLIDFVVGVFTGDWERAWDGIVGIFEGIGEALIGVINGIIAAINGLISGVCAGINTVINAMNKLRWTIPDWVPGGMGGKTFGFNLKTISVPQIPYLAQGAVLPPNEPFMAVVGDQRHGTNVEAPLATIQEAVAVVMADYNAANMAGMETIVALLRDILEAILGIQIGDDVITAAVQRHQAKMAVVRGGNA